MSEEKIELTTRGQKQIRNVVQSELKPVVDTVIRESVDRVVINRVNNILNDIRYTIEDIVKKQVKEMYWEIMKNALLAADFQELFKTEIINYLNKRWANGSIPFDLEFDKALIKAVKSIIIGKP